MVSVSPLHEHGAEAPEASPAPGAAHAPLPSRLIAALARRRPPPLLSYGLVPIMVVVSALVGWLLGMAGTPFAPFVPGIFAAGLLLGLGEALFALALSTVAGVGIFIDPGLQAPLTGPQFTSLMVFLILFGLICAANSAVREGALAQASQLDRYRTLHARIAASALALRQSEEALRELNATLEDKVAARTAERDAAREALGQAQKMEALGNLAGGLAHDFNNLLSGIVGGLDLARSRLGAEPPEDVAGPLDLAADFADRASGLTRRLLAFARRETLSPVKLDLAELIAGMRGVLAQTLGPSIALDLHLGDAGSTVWADPSEVENAVLNLSINARDAMPEGGRMAIALAAMTLLGDAAAALALQPGRYLALSVADTGCGMTSEMTARAFEPFFTTKSAGRGTGLGLAAVYGFVRRSGGQARIASQPGEGTEVTLYLPRD